MRFILKLVKKHWIQGIMNYYVIVFQTDWNLSLEKCIQKSIKLKENMLENGADGAVMSGSGPTVYGLTQKERQARHVYNAVNGCCNEVYIARLLG